MMNSVASVMMNDGRPVLQNQHPIDESHDQACQGSDEDRGPDVPAVLDRQQGHDHPGGADHGPDREIEFAADHQQRHRHGEDPELGRYFQVAGRPAGREETPVAGDDREIEPDRRRPDHSAHFRANQEPAYNTRAKEPVVVRTRK